MKPIKITVKSKKLDSNRAQWSLSLTDSSCATYMCETIIRPRAANITVSAELAAIWTALQQIRGYQWIEINCTNETEAVITGFLYLRPASGYKQAYRYFKYFCDKHDLMINPDRALSQMVTRVMELNPAMRSRVRRASQLVTMGAVWRHRKSGYSCWTKSHPQNPYHIKRSNGQWECNCPDSNAPTLTRNSSMQVCKHLLAAMMSFRLSAERVRPALRKAA